MENTIRPLCAFPFDISPLNWGMLPGTLAMQSIAGL